jgi:hypothetical protein
MAGQGLRSGWERVAGRPDGKRVGSGLTTRGATSPLDGATVGGAVGAGVSARGATSPSSGVTAGLSGARTGCGGVTGPSDDAGAGWGRAVGNGGLLDTWGCLSVLGLAGNAGRRASIARGAVSLVIGAAAGMGASLGDVCAGVGPAVGVGGHWSPLACPFAVEGHGLVVGSDASAGSGDRGGGVSFPLGSARSPPLVSAFSPCSSPLTSPPSAWLWLVVSAVRCLRLVSRASRRIRTTANVPRM